MRCPAGFAFAATPPTNEALTFSKQPVAEAEALVGRSILYNWPCIGWYPGVLQRRVMDGGRIKRSSKSCNFYIYYKVDDDEVPSVLSLDEYGSEEEGGWLLLEAVGATV